MPTAKTQTPQSVTQTTPTRTTRTPPTSSSLERAIAPIAIEHVLAERWERQPVTETALRTPAFRLVQAGEQLGRYTTELSWRPKPFTGVADVRRVLAAFEAGATIALNLPQEAPGEPARSRESPQRRDRKALLSLAIPAYPRAARESP